MATLSTAGLALTGCDFGHPGGFTARSNSFCAQTADQVSKLKHPDSGLEHMQYATDRYTLVEKLVSELTDSALPGGTEGTQLRDRWLRPARASLTDGRAVLADLRSALNSGDATGLSTAFTRSLAIGTQGVDTSLLRDHALNSCATAFEPTPA